MICGSSSRLVLRRKAPTLVIVQAALAQKSACPGNILLRILQKMRGHVLRRVNPHGAELQDIEMCLMDAYPLLFEKHGPFGIQLDGCHQQEENR